MYRPLGLALTVFVAAGCSKRPAESLTPVPDVAPVVVVPAGVTAVDEAAVDVVARLDAEYAADRLKAMWELMDLGENARDAIPALKTIADEPDLVVGRGARAVLCTADPANYRTHILALAAKTATGVTPRKGAAPRKGAVSRRVAREHLPGEQQAMFRLAAVRGLESADPETRTAAFDVLGTTGPLPADSPATRVLEKLLADRTQPAHEDAKRYLAETDPGATIRGWISYLKAATEPADRRAAAEVIPKAVAALVLSDVAAARGPNPGPPAEALDALDALLDDPDADVRAHVASALVQAGRYERALPIVLAFPWPKLERVYDPAVANGPSDRTIDRVGALPAVIESTLKRLPASAKEAVRPIAAAALKAAKTRHAKWAAVRCLERAGNTDLEAIRPVLRDDDPEVHAFVVESLCYTQAVPAAAPILLPRLVKDPKEGSFPPSWKVPFATAEMALLAQIQTLKEFPPETLAFLLDRITPDRTTSLTTYYLYALPTEGAGAEKSAAAVAAILKSEQRKDHYVRGACYTVVAKLGPAAKAAAPLLVALKPTVYVDEVRPLEEAILAVNGPNDSVIKSLIARVDSRNPPQGVLLAALPKSDLARAEIPKWTAALKDHLDGKSDDVSGPNAAMLLMAVGPNAATAVPLLKRYAAKSLAPYDQVAVLEAVARMAPAEAPAIEKQLGEYLDPTAGRDPTEPDPDNARDRWSIWRQETEAANERASAARAALVRLADTSVTARAVLRTAAERNVIFSLPASCGPTPAATVRLRLLRHKAEIRDWDFTNRQLYPAELDAVAVDLTHPDAAVRADAWDVVARSSPLYRRAAPRLAGIARGETDPAAKKMAEVAVALAEPDAPRPPELQRRIAIWAAAVDPAEVPYRIASAQDRKRYRGLGYESGALYDWRFVGAADAATLRANLPTLLKALDSESLMPSSDGEGSEELCRILVKAAPDSIAPVAERLRHPLQKVRWRAASVLRRIGPAAATVAPAARTQLASSDADVRLVAATVLARIESPVAADVVAELARQVPDLKASQSALAVLGEIGGGARPAADAVAAAAGDDKPYAVLAADTLVRVDPNRGDVAIRALLRAAADQRKNSIYGTETLPAVQALVRFPRGVTAATSALREAMADANPALPKPILARVLRRVDPAAARELGVR